MERRVPACSAQFTQDKLHPLPHIHPLDTITWEQACGDSTGKAVKVAIIDSGIDARHPALKGPVNGYVSIVTDNDRVSYDTSVNDDSCGHGTECAGNVSSIAP